MKDLDHIAGVKAHRMLYSNGITIHAYAALIKGRMYNITAGDNEGGKEHVAVSPMYGNSIPSWDVLCIVKRMFWEDDEECYQVFPRKQDYINFMDTCMHIWRLKDSSIELGERG